MTFEGRCGPGHVAGERVRFGQMEGAIPDFRSRNTKEA
jgi:hypothetical protein